MECLICDGVYNIKRDCCPYCGAFKVGNKHYDKHNGMRELARVIPRKIVQFSELRIKSELA